jgi:peptide/nickel transport system substrate-binding protein
MGTRRWAKFAGLISLLVAVSACAPAAPSGGGPTSGSSADPKRGGVFTIASRSAPSSLNPYVGFGLPEEITFASTVYETLLTLDHDPNKDMRVDFQIVPNLAESWESNGPTTHTVKLRKDVVWHDGKPFTADDVVHTFSYVYDPKNALKARGFIPSFEAATKVDDHTVRFTLKYADPSFIRQLADRRTMMMPKHVIDAGGAYDKTVVGTGPFKLVSYDQVAGTTLARFDQYWDKPKPYLDGFKVLYGLDNSAQVAGYISQQLDVYSTTNKGELDTILAAVPQSNQRTSAGIFNNSIYFNLSKPPFNDVRVRRAIHLGVDRQALVRGIADGAGVLGPPGGISGLVKHLAIPETEFLQWPGWTQPKDADHAEAKRLLTEAGFPNGLTTSMTVPSARITSGKIMEAVTGQLKQIGVTMELRPTEFGVYAQAESSGGYDMVPILIGNPENQNKPWYNFFHSKGTTNPFIRNTELDKLIEDFELATDDARKAQIARQVQDIIYKEMYAAPTIDLPNWNVWQAWVTDYSMNWGGNAYVYNPRELWFDKAKGAPSRSI